MKIPDPSLFKKPWLWTLLIALVCYGHWFFTLAVEGSWDWLAVGLGYLACWVWSTTAGSDGWSNFLRFLVAGCLFYLGVVSVFVVGIASVAFIDGGSSAPTDAETGLNFGRFLHLQVLLAAVFVAVWTYRRLSALRAQPKLDPYD